MAAPPHTTRPRSGPLSWMGSWHRAFLAPRRTRVLAEMLLDVGKRSIESFLLIHDFSLYDSQMWRVHGSPYGRS